MTLDPQHQLGRDLDRLSAMVERMGDVVGRLDSRVTTLEALDSRHSLLCPYREDIQRSRNNRDLLDTHSTQIKDLQKGMSNQRVLSTRTATMVGSIASLVGGAVAALVNRFMGG